MRNVVVRIQPLPTGRWEPGADLCEGPLLGLLVLEGVMVRREELLGKSAHELLVARDIFHPGHRRRWGSIRQTTAWSVLEPARLALLGEGFQRAVAEHPAIMVKLMRRLGECCDDRLARLALARTRQLAPRIRGLLWQLADRVGRAQNGDVEIPLALSHAQLAELAGAERAAVTRAVHTLERQGLVQHRRGGSWRLLGGPPAS